MNHIFVILLVVHVVIAEHPQQELPSLNFGSLNQQQNLQLPPLNLQKPLNPQPGLPNQQHSLGLPPLDLKKPLPPQSSTPDHQQNLQLPPLNLNKPLPPQPSLPDQQHSLGLPPLNSKKVLNPQLPSLNALKPFNPQPNPSGQDATFGSLPKLNLPKIDESNGKKEEPGDSNKGIQGSTPPLGDGNAKQSEDGSPKVEQPSSTVVNSLGLGIVTASNNEEVANSDNEEVTNSDNEEVANSDNEEVADSDNEKETNSETVEVSTSENEGEFASDNEDVDIEGRGILKNKQEYSHLKLKKCEKGCVDKKLACQIIAQEKKCHKLNAKQLRKCKCSCKKCGKGDTKLRMSSDTNEDKGKSVIDNEDKGKLEYNHKQCGERINKDILKIIGGREARIGAWPWIVGLIRVTEGLTEDERLLKPTFCGGTLINPRTVVTAAHCFELFPYLTTDSINVRVGDLHVDKKEDGEKVLKVKKIVKHNKWNRRTYEYDIAMLILAKDVDIPETSFPVNTACLPTSNLIVSKNCFVAGWGVEKEGSRQQAKTLMQIKVPLVPYEKCNAHMANPIRRGMMCAGKRKPGKDACQGDSGGPLVCKKKGKFELRGIVSWGEGCARRGKFGVYTDVRHYMEWIKHTMVNYV